VGVTNSRRRPVLLPRAGRAPARARPAPAAF
jgi:hypothetical protein